MRAPIAWSQSASANWGNAWRSRVQHAECIPQRLQPRVKRRVVAAAVLRTDQTGDAQENERTVRLTVRLTDCRRASRVEQNCYSIRAVLRAQCTVRSLPASAVPGRHPDRAARSAWRRADRAAGSSASRPRCTCVRVERTGSRALRYRARKEPTSGLRRMAPAYFG